jgi:hypothetical protein
MSHAVNLAPIKSNIEPQYEGRHSPPGPLSSISRIVPALPTPTFDRPAPYSQLIASAPLPAQPEPVRLGKRSFDSLSNASSAAQRLVNGMRPNTSHQGLPTADEEEEEDMSATLMTYKRANGESTNRPAPITS